MEQLDLVVGGCHGHGQAWASMTRFISLGLFSELIDLDLRRREELLSGSERDAALDVGSSG
jgi:hypothetical protein